MTVFFWFIAFSLLALALAFVLVPLLRGNNRAAAAVEHAAVNVSIYRDQLAELEADLAAGNVPPEQYASARRELEKRLLEEAAVEAPPAAAAGGAPRWLTVTLALAIPVIALPLYLLLGNPAGLDPTKSNDVDTSHALNPEMIRNMVKGLSARLQENPDDIDGWQMLSRSYMVLGQFDDAAKAFGELAKRAPQTADLYADYADVVALAQGKKLAGEPEKLIEKALQIDPNHVKALALAGTAAFEKNQFSRAAALWQKILAQVPPDSDTARSIQASIQEAQSRAGGGAAPAAKVARDTAPAAASSVSVSGGVELGQAAKAAVKSTDTVFIFARAVNGPKMPLAIMKVTAKDLPIKFKLDDSMAMAPGAMLSKFPEVAVSARVSKSGAATPAPGDWEAVPVLVKPGEAGIRLTIEREVK